MSVTEYCFAPSEVIKVLPISKEEAALINGLAGQLAERLIEADYLKKTGGLIFADHFLDNPITSSYIAFLAVKNPRIRNARDLATLAILANMPGGGIKRPDILTDMGGTKEYYEIKPDSADGLRDGRAKLRDVGVLLGTYSLPYSKGTSYTPSKIPIPELQVPLSVILPTPIAWATEVNLSPKRTESGLIQYLYCIKTDWTRAKGVARAMAAAAAAILIAVLGAALKARLPRIEPFPVPGPIAFYARRA